MTANQSSAALAPAVTETPVLPPAPPQPRKQKLTPREVAKFWGVPLSRVKAWIRSGELRAMDASTKLASRRPLLLIDLAALKEFEANREEAARQRVLVKIVPIRPRRGGRRKKRQLMEVEEFF